jgi:cancer susceptibility candidate protein 1
MQNIQGEALSMYDKSKLAWCKEYRELMREIELQKYDEICAHVLEFIENYTRNTPEEIAELKNSTKTRGKGDLTHREKLIISETTKDLMFSVWGNVLGKSVMHKRIEFGPYEAAMPMNKATMQIIFRCIWTSYDYMSPDKIQDDLVVGGIVDFQMYEYPKICELKPSNKWAVRKVLPVNERLIKQPFPESAAGNAIETPVEVSFKIPPYLFIGDDITALKIGVWDSAKGEWSTDYIAFGKEDSKKDSRQILFTTTKFAPMAMLQSRCMDYPYQNWWLRCVSEDLALLDLWTKRIQLRIEISPLLVKLVECEIPELQHLNNKQLQPGKLLLELQRCGINLMPRDEDAKLAGIELKDRAAEERAIIDVSNSVRAFHFRKAVWNQGVAAEEGIGANQVLIRLRENLEFDEKFLEDFEPDWRYVSWWNNKCAFQAGCKDTDKQCHAKLPDSQVTHALLSQAIESQCSVQAYQTTIDYTQVEFADTLKKTLRLLRLFSFS